MAGEERIALIEVSERDGRVRQQIEVQRWPLTIGRSLDCDLVLDDPHVAPRHARLAVGDDGQLWLEVGDTVNGVRIGHRLLHAGERVALGRREALHLGHTRLRLRLRDDDLPAEKPLAVAAGLGGTLLFSLLLWGLVLAQHAIELDPGAGLTAWLPLLLGPPLAMALWCGAWALASKLFQHRFEFAAHWALASRWLLVILLGGIVLTLAGAALGWPALVRIVGLAEAAALTAWLFFHARLVLPHRANGLALSFGAAFAVGVAVLVALNQQREQPWAGPLYMHVLPPHPKWRIEQAQPVERFVEQARKLRTELDARAAAEPNEADTPAFDTTE